MATKPPLGTMVDPTHSLANSLDMAFLFNEGSGITVADSSGNGWTGTLLGNNGKLPLWENTYLNFLGDNAQRVRIDNSDVWNSGAGGDFTIVIRIRPQGPVALQDYVSRENDSGLQLGDFRMARSTALTFIVIDNDSAGHISFFNEIPALSFQTVIGRQNSVEGSLWINGIEGGTPAAQTPNIDDQNDGFDIGIGNLHGGKTDSTTALVGHVEFVYIYSRALSNAEIAEITVFPYQMYNPAVTNPVGSRGTLLSREAPSGATSTQWEIVSALDTPSNVDDPFTVVTDASGINTSPNILAGDLDSLEIWLPPSHSYILRIRHFLNNGSFTEFSPPQTFTSRGPLNSFDKFFALSVNTVTKANGVIEDITTGGIIVDESDNIDVIE